MSGAVDFSDYFSDFLAPGVSATDLPELERLQRADHRRGGDAFAHRYRVHPDAAGFHRRQAEGETFVDTPSVRYGSGAICIKSRKWSVPNE